MAHTTFTNYTTEELLRLVDDKRTRSPLIDELCTRLEASADEAVDQVKEDTSHEAPCPICAAELVVAYDVAANKFKLNLGD
jgi:hypothetical protein